MWWKIILFIKRCLKQTELDNKLFKNWCLDYLLPVLQEVDVSLRKVYSLIEKLPLGKLQKEKIKNYVKRYHKKETAEKLCLRLINYYNKHC